MYFVVSLSELRCIAHALQLPNAVPNSPTKPVHEKKRASVISSIFGRMTLDPEWGEWHTCEYLHVHVSVFKDMQWIQQAK